MTDHQQQDSGNGFDGDQLAAYLETIDDADSELLELHASYMASCKAPKSRIKDAMATARKAGINMVAFRVVLADHRAKRKQAKRIANLEADDVHDFEAMIDALGEFGSTPLGKAALDRARPQGEATLNSLR
jgi:hypothetical protein